MSYNTQENHSVQSLMNEAVARQQRLLADHYVELIVEHEATPIVSSEYFVPQTIQEEDLFFKKFGHHSSF